MTMTFEDIFETLKMSVDYVEFMITYNELIPEIVKAKNNSEFSEWTKFIKGKNNLKKYLYAQHRQDYFFEYTRLLAESKYIYDIDVSLLANELEKIYKQQTKFKKLFPKL